MRGQREVRQQIERKRAGCFRNGVKRRHPLPKLLNLRKVVGLQWFRAAQLVHLGGTHAPCNVTSLKASEQRCFLVTQARP